MSRLLMIIAALLLTLLFLFPMWKIELMAPQYPEGLEMHIWVNKIGGNSEFTLQNFNILNHYIGMAEINEDSFKELQVIPYIVVFFIISGLIVAIIKSRYLKLSWVILLSIAGTIGLLDFYFWLHEFGTNLDPTAPIKVPGMTYIPPFIGGKELLNFNAFSFPALGGFAVAASVVLASIAAYLDIRKNKKTTKNEQNNPSSSIRTNASSVVQTRS